MIAGDVECMKTIRKTKDSIGICLHRIVNEATIGDGLGGKSKVIAGASSPAPGNKLGKLKWAALSSASHPEEKCQIGNSALLASLVRNVRAILGNSAIDSSSLAVSKKFAMSFTALNFKSMFVFPNGTGITINGAPKLGGGGCPNLISLNKFLERLK